MTVKQDNASDGWDGARNAHFYARYARDFAMYRKTSADLVAMLRPAPGDTILDLACGTGATTQEILSALGPDGRVVAVDGSESMLAEAKDSIDDSRVWWLHGRAEQVDQVVSVAVDGVVCNSAMWLTDMPTTFPAIRRLMRPGGKLAFNITTLFIDEDGQDGVDAPLHWPALIRKIYEIAARRYRWSPPAELYAPYERPFRVQSVSRELSQAGFSVEIHSRYYEQSNVEARNWLQLPLIREYYLPGLSETQYGEVLDELASSVDNLEPVPAKWVVFTGTAAERPAETIAQTR